MDRKISNWGGTIAAFMLVIYVNYLSNALPLNGYTQKDLSDKYTSLFTPAGFTFSIWGVIYLALTIFVIYQALPSQRHNQLISKVSRLFILSCFANILWLLTWHYEFVSLSLLVMFSILFTLIAIYRHLGAYRKQATWEEYLFLHLPFSLYIAWITVATMANISVVQNAMGWDDIIMGAIHWTLFKLVIVASISAFIILRRGDVVFGFVIAWAAFGIMSKQVDTPAVANAAATLIAFAILLSAYESIRQLSKK